MIFDNVQAPRAIHQARIAFLAFFKGGHTTREASRLLDNTYQVRHHITGNPMPSEPGHTLVTDLWRMAPHLAKPHAAAASPVLLAATALVHAIRQSPREADRDEFGSLLSTFMALWLSDARRKAPPDHLTEQDSQLFDQLRDVVASIWADHPASPQPASVIR